MTPSNLDLLPRPTCPRCGSTRLDVGTVIYADGPVPYHLCQECAYLDLQQLPTYISPKTTTKVTPEERRLPTGDVASLPRQAGIIDPETATGTLPPGSPLDQSLAPPDQPRAGH